MKKQQTQELILECIIAERERQIKKFGEQKHNYGRWLAILLEEVGKAAQAILKSDFDDVVIELVQCAAVIVAWLEDALNNAMFLSDRNSFSEMLIDHYELKDKGKK